MRASLEFQLSSLCPTVSKKANTKVLLYLHGERPGTGMHDTALQACT
jgi:hypothetical protein